MPGKKGRKKGDIGVQGFVKWTNVDKVRLFTVQRHLIALRGLDTRPSVAEIVRHCLRREYRRIKRMEARRAPPQEGR